MYKSVVVSLQRILVYFSFVFFTACGGGESSNEQDLSLTSFQPQLFIAGGGIKGPLAFASVELYALNMEFVELYEPGNPIATAATNAYAEITGLSVPRDSAPPYVLIIDGTNAIDRNTSVAPVIKNLVTIITQEAMNSGLPVYATPYTTLAYNMLVNTSKDTSEAPAGSIVAALTEFNRQIIQSIGFGISEETDIFKTPPIITASTTSIEQQELVVNYRAAIEALSSLLHEMFLSSSDGITTDALLQLLAFDLQSDGVIDGVINDQASSNIDIGILSQDPMTLEMPNTKYFVRNIISLIDEERAFIGGSANTVFLKEDVSVYLQAISTSATDSSDLTSTVENPVETSYPSPMEELASTLLGSGLIASGPIVINSATDSSGLISTIENSVGTSYPSPMGELASTLLASGLIASGPIMINGESDVVISGLHISNPNGRCIEIRNASANIVIENSEIGPCKDEGVYIESSENITIRDTYIHDTKGVGIRTFSAERIHVTSNQIERVASGVLAGKSKQVDINNNYFLNVQGPYPRGQIVQFVRVSGPGNRINNNIGINEVGKSYAEDTINIYSSHGTPDDYIQVNDNILVGGGPSRSGGGILLGDNDSSYAIADGNILVNPGATGIKIASGHHLILTNNKVFSDRKDFTNTAVPIGNQAKNREEFGCHSLEVSNNEITFWKGTEFLKDGQTEPFLSPYWKWGGCGTITGWETNKFDTPNNQPANLDESILPTGIRNLQ